MTATDAARVELDRLEEMAKAVPRPWAHIAVWSTTALTLAVITHLRGVLDRHEPTFAHLCKWCIDPWPCPDVRSAFTVLTVLGIKVET